MSILSIFLCIVNAYLLARYAREKFASVLAVSIVITSIASAVYYSIAFKSASLLTSGLFWGLVLGFALVIFLLANPLRYFLAWLIVFSIILFGILIPFEIKMSSTVGGITALVSAIPVYLFRKEIKLIMIGIMSGSNIAMSLIIAVYLISPQSALISSGIFYTLLFLAAIAGGVLFQFKFYEKYFGSKS